MSPEPIGDTGGTPSGGSGGASPAPGSSGSASAVVQRPSLAGASSSDAIGTNGDGDFGPVKYERFKEVNDKYTRLKWAEDFGDEEPETIKGQVALARWARDDPRGFRAWYDSQLEAHGLTPVPQQRANGNGHAAVPEGPPGPDRRDPTTGDTYYTAAQAEKLAQYYAEQNATKFDQRLGPIEQMIARARVQSQAASEAKQILSEVTKWPEFEANRPKIFEAMRKNPRLDVKTAYIQIVVPTLESRARQDVIASTEAKTGATTISPSSAQGNGREDLTKLPIRTLLRREFQKRGIGR